MIRTISLRLQRVLFTTLTGYFGLTTGLFRTENFVSVDNEDDDEDNVNQRIARALGVETSWLPPSVMIQQHDESPEEDDEDEEDAKIETKSKRGKSMSPPSSPLIRKRNSSGDVDSPLVLASTRMWFGVRVFVTIECVTVVFEHEAQEL